MSVWKWNLCGHFPPACGALIGLNIVTIALIVFGEIAVGFRIANMSLTYGT